jgi:membrane protein DedA with SNARE-associated domain
VIARLLDPVLNLHGWEAYSIVGALVFAEASILIGFFFPGETAVILGGVAASRDHINIVILFVVVVGCGIAGDSVGYLVGYKWGRGLLHTGLLRKRQRLRTGFCLLGYILGHAYTKVEHASGIASDVLLGLIVAAIVVLFIRRRRRERSERSGEAVTPKDVNWP